MNGTFIARQRFARWSQQLPLLSTAVVCAILYAAASFRYTGFFAAGTFFDFFGNSAVLGVAAVGLTFVILSGGIDLSVGSMIGFSSILTGLLVERWHLNPWLVIALVLLTGAAFGLVNGFLIHVFGMASFLVTLAGMFILRGLALTIAPVEQRISILNEVFLWPGGHSIPMAGFSLRLIALMYLMTAVIGAIVLRYTAFGRNVYAIGGNEQSALLMGLPVGRTKVLVYVISGFCSALAGIVRCMDLGAADPLAAVGLELDAIAAVVIGGTLLTGGVGSMAGTVLGVLILAMIQMAITFEPSLTSWWTKIVVGGLLLVFIALQKVLVGKNA